MANLKLVQCLCPQRHCILALMFRDIPDQFAIEVTRQSIQDVIQTNKINPWCGLCGAKAEAWHYEAAPLKQTDFAEALMELRAVEQEQLQTAELLKTCGKAYERPRGLGSMN